MSAPPRETLCDWRCVRIKQLTLTNLTIKAVSSPTQAVKQNKRTHSRAVNHQQALAQSRKTPSNFRPGRFIGKYQPNPPPLHPHPPKFSLLSPPIHTASVISTGTELYKSHRPEMNSKTCKDPICLRRRNRKRIYISSSPPSRPPPFSPPSKLGSGRSAARRPCWGIDNNRWPMSVTLYRRREVRGCISNSNKIQSSGNVRVKKALKYRPEKRLTTDWAPTGKKK